MDIEQKAVIVRDGARGRFLADCFVSDALGLLGPEAEGITHEDECEQSENYETDCQCTIDAADGLEVLLNEAGYTVYWYDGYVIYKDLTEAEKGYIYAD
jgi:hypothetical protein